MSKESLSKDLRSFIHSHINSIEQLEVLQFLFYNASESWTAANIAAKLYIQPTSAETRLNDLTAKQLCTMSGNIPPEFKYAPADREKEGMVSLLLEAYKVRRDAVITTIFSRPSDHVTAFSDAFRLRKDS